MALENSKGMFTWGDEVIVSPSAPEKMKPGELGYIVGVTEINSDYLSKKHEVKMGGYIYTVEYSDGTSSSIPEEFLQKKEL